MDETHRALRHRVKGVAVTPSWTIDVAAREPWVDTGITLEAGATYEFSASGTWTDRGIVTGPAGYPSANLIQRIFAWRKRERDAPWFALIGTVDRRKGSEFVIAEGCTRTFDETGTLVCFANDVRSAYGNNHGCVTLTVTRAP